MAVQEERVCGSDVADVEESGPGVQEAGTFINTTFALG